MDKDTNQDTNSTAPASEPHPHHVRLPGFLIEEEIGLGDVIKKTTYRLGIKPCAGCEQRAEALNRWMTFHR
jgi:hypothetical protein